MIVKFPVELVIVPAKADTKSEDVPESAVVVVKRVMFPLVALLIVFNSARV